MPKSKISPAIISCVTSICLLTQISVPQVRANNLNLPENQQTNSSKTPKKSSSRLRFRLPNRGVPGARVSGATRNSSGKSVSAILPNNKLGLTVSHSPMIFVYIPKNQSTQAILTITDEQKNLVYRGDFVAPQEVGILRIRLPETIDLETDKMYKWTVQLVPSSYNPIINSKLKTFGWVSKVSLDEDSLDEEQTWANLENLAQAGIWYDTLEQLAKLRSENPQNAQLEIEWNELLASVGLENFSDNEIFSEPIEIKANQIEESTLY